MAPKPNNLTLSKDAFAQSSDGQSASDEYPTEVKLVISGSAGVKAVDSLAIDWKKNGFGKTKGKTALSGIVYELSQGEKADPAMEAFSVSNEAPNNIPLTLVHPLVAGVNGSLPPKDSSPQHAFISFSLPTIYKAEELQGDNEAKWLALLKEASERSLTLEMGLGGDQSVLDALEKLFGKAWDEEAERAKKEEKDVNTTGVRIIFDSLASPPLAKSHSQQLNSKDLEIWSDFVRRLALHPRVFLKLSPLPSSSLLPESLSTPLRSADAPGSSVSSTLAGAVHSISDAALQAVSTTESTLSPAERKAELLRRLHIYLDVALEAFGDERLVWAAHQGTGSAALIGANALVDKEGSSLSEAETWFEVVRESLTGSGLKQASLDNIFAK